MYNRRNHRSGCEIPRSARNDRRTTRWSVVVQSTKKPRKQVLSSETIQKEAGDMDQDQDIDRTDEPDVFETTVHKTNTWVKEISELLRGFYYEGWKPSATPVKIKTLQEFYELVRQNFTADRNVNPMRLTEAVMAVLSANISPGELEKLRGIFPEELRALWLGATVGSNR
jgi:uncharacterized protein (DUF2267 family)